MDRRVDLVFLEVGDLELSRLNQKLGVRSSRRLGARDVGATELGLGRG
jgi:hypothetical protein